MTTVADLVRQLRALGLRPGDVVMAHVSLRALGPVDGGAAGLAAALDEAVGPAGTVLVNPGARDDVPVFDPLTTPADPDTGVFAEVFRTLPGTAVVDHPDARLAARGPAAAALFAEQPWDDYYGPGSPLERFVDGGGRVLRIGADLDTVTALHLAEYRCAVPEPRRVVRHHRVAGPDGPQVRAVSCLDDTDGIAPWDGGDYFAAVLTAYLAARPHGAGTVGAARSELVDAADLVAFGADWMTRHLRA